MRTFVILFAVVTLATTAHGQVRTRGTVAFVDYESVYTNFYKTRLANDQLKQLQASFIEARRQLIDQLNTAMNIYSGLRDGLMDPELEENKRTAMRREAEQKLAEIRQIEKNVRTHDESSAEKVRDQQVRIRTRYNDEIKERLKGYAKAKGYAAILDRTFVTGELKPGVLYYDEDADITEDVIREINK